MLKTHIHTKVNKYILFFTWRVPNVLSVLLYNLLINHRLSFNLTSVIGPVPFGIKNSQERGTRQLQVTTVKLSFLLQVLLYNFE